MLERDSVATARALTAIHATDAMTRSASEWFVGLAARTFGDASKAHSAFTAARAILEKVVRDQPDYAPAWSRLGLIDAALVFARSDFVNVHRKPFVSRSA